MKNLEKIHHSLKNYEIDEKGNIYKNGEKLPFSKEFKYAGISHKIEKVIAKVYLNNLFNKRTVIFKDGNEENINLDNLEWSSINQETYNNRVKNDKYSTTRCCVKCKQFRDLEEYYNNNQGNKCTICKYCQAERRKIKKDIYNENRKNSRSAELMQYSLENKIKYEKFKENPEKYKEFLNKIKLYKEENWWIDIIYRLRNRAKQLNLPFDLEKSDLIIPEFCPILEIPIAIRHENKANCVSWDRIIPELGYVKGNVRAISLKANLMKSNATFEELQLFAVNIIKYINKEI